MKKSRKAPRGMTKKEFRVQKRLEFHWMRETVNEFLKDYMYTPIPPNCVSEVKEALENIEWYIGTEAWGH